MIIVINEYDRYTRYAKFYNYTYGWGNKLILDAPLPAKPTKVDCSGWSRWLMWQVYRIDIGEGTVNQLPYFLNHYKQVTPVEGKNLESGMAFWKKTVAHEGHVIPLAMGVAFDSHGLHNGHSGPSAHAWLSEPYMSECLTFDLRSPLR